MRRSTLLRLVPVLLALAVGVSACGGSDDPEPADATIARPRSTATQQTPTVRTTATTPTVTTPTQTTPAPPPQTTTQPPATTPATPPDDSGGSTVPSAPPSTTPQDSGGASTPASATCGNVAGGFISGVQATGADCGEATGVASAWLDAIGESGPDADVAAAGFACSGALEGQKTSVTCIADGGKRVTFSASP